MSALFFKKDYFKQIESLVEAGKFEAALNVAIKVGDSFYEKNEPEKASDLYEKLIKLFEEANFSDRKVFEKLYEKLIPLLFEEGKTEEAMEKSLKLIDIKIALDKNEEADEILSALKEEFRNNEKVFLKDVDINLRKGRVEDALDTLKYMIAHISPDPKYMELATELLLKLDRKKEALDYINTLISLDPGNAFAEAKLKELKIEPDKGVKKDNLQNKQFSERDINKVKNISNKQSAGKTGKVDTKLGSSQKDNKPSFYRKTASVKKNENGDLSQKSSVDSSTKEVESQVKSKETENKKKSEEIHRQISNEVFEQEEYKSAVLNLLADSDDAFNKLMDLAGKYENEEKLYEAEYLYLKAFVVKPEDGKVVEDLIRIYDKTKRTEDKIFILRIAEKYAKGRKKVEYMVKISELAPDNDLVKMQIVKNAALLGDKDLALRYFNLAKNIDKDKRSLNEILDLLFPLVNKDLDILKGFAVKIKRVGLDTKTAFKYYLATGKLLFSMGDKPEGLKWLMRANEIEKLPLEDYIKIAEYIKEVPLDTEKDIVASALNGYIDVISSEDEKEHIFKLILSLKPNNTLYIKKYAEFLKSKGKYKEVAHLVKKLISKSDVNSLDLVGESLPKIAEYLDDETLIKAAELFVIDGNTFKAAEIYEILQLRNPDDKQYLIKKFVLQIENEDIENIVKFFDKTPPSHNFSDFVEPEILKFEKKRTLSPFDYHVHFVLGFLYYLTERYEEAIASFQFVLRSHRFEILMYLFLGMSFEKIGLPDFAIKRYQAALEANVENEFIKKMTYTRIISLLIKQGKFKEAREFVQKATNSGVAGEEIAELVKSIPDDDKIIHIKEMKND